MPVETNNLIGYFFEKAPSEWGGGKFIYIMNSTDDYILKWFAKFVYTSFDNRDKSK